MRSFYQQSYLRQLASIQVIYLECKFMLFMNFQIILLCYFNALVGSVFMIPVIPYKKFLLQLLTLYSQPILIVYTTFLPYLLFIQSIPCYPLLNKIRLTFLSVKQWQKVLAVAPDPTIKYTLLSFFICYCKACLIPKQSVLQPFRSRPFFTKVLITFIYFATPISQTFLWSMNYFLYGMVIEKPEMDQSCIIQSTEGILFDYGYSSY